MFQATEVLRSFWSILPTHRQWIPATDACSANARGIGFTVSTCLRKAGGVVLQADQNAARNGLARLSDPDIDRLTPYRQVKTIWQARTERLRLGLLNQDSSCSPARVLSTERE